LIFNSTNDAVCIVDLQGQFIEVNQVMCDRLGYRREELLKMTVRDITAPVFAAGVPHRIGEILRDGQAVFETAHTWRDGTVIPVEVSGRAIDYEGKRAILSVVRDITERSGSKRFFAKARNGYGWRRRPHRWSPGTGTSSA
jgi:PAS domain S-box-containing protein